MLKKVEIERKFCDICGDSSSGTCRICKKDFCWDCAIKETTHFDEIWGTICNACIIKSPKLSKIVELTNKFEELKQKHRDLISLKTHEITVLSDEFSDEEEEKSDAT